jgi:hypothetical protein
VQTENEKAVRTLFEEWLAETQYAQDSESFHNELYSAWKSGRQSAERSQAALQSQVSNTPQDGPNIQSLNICPRNSGHPHMFSKPGTIDSCRHCGLSEREWKVKAEAKLLAAQTPQQQEQSGEEFDVARLGNIRVIMNKYGWPDEIVDAAVPLYLAPPTSTAIVAMVTKKVTDGCREKAVLNRGIRDQGTDRDHYYFFEGQAVACEELARWVDTLTPANAEAELEALMIEAVKRGMSYEEANHEAGTGNMHEAASAIVRRVLDEKKGK